MLEDGSAFRTVIRSGPGFSDDQSSDGKGRATREWRGGGWKETGSAAEPEGGALQDPRLHTEPTSRLLEMLCSEHPPRGPHHALLSWLTGHVSSSSEFSLLERKLSEDENKHRTNSQFQRWGLDRARQRGSTP